MKTERSGLRRMRFWVGVALLLGIGVPASAATWLEVEASGIVLRFQEVDRGIAGPLLGELVVGRSEVGRKLGGGFNVPMTVYLASSEGIFQ